MKCAAIIAAAGSGSRIQSQLPKQLLPLGGYPLFVWSVRVFRQVERIAEIIVAVPAGNIEQFQTAAADAAMLKWVTGGTRRQDSVLAALESASSEAEIVLVHDAARPFISVRLVNLLIDTTIKAGAAIPIAPIAETLKEVSDGRVISTLDRERIYRAQTPQAFLRQALTNVFRSVRHERTWTDEASMFESEGIPVAVVPGDSRNIKITYPEDFQYAEYLLTKISNFESPIPSDE